MAGSSGVVGSGSITNYDDEDEDETAPRSWNRLVRTPSRLKPGLRTSFQFFRQAGNAFSEEARAVQFALADAGIERASHGGGSGLAPDAAGFVILIERPGDDHAIAEHEHDQGHHHMLLATDLPA